MHRVAEEKMNLSSIQPLNTKYMPMTCVAIIQDNQRIRDNHLGKADHWLQDHLRIQKK